MDKRLKFILSLSFIVQIYLSLNGQNLLQPFPIPFEELGVKQGLSQGMINCIMQDKEGYIWIATKNGLNRYDGYNIITYHNNSNDSYSLPDNYCITIAEDDKGYLWIGTFSKGLFLFDKTTEKFYGVGAINSNKENLYIVDLKFASGKLFIKTWTNGFILDIHNIDILKNSIINVEEIFNYNNNQPNKKFKLGHSDYSIWSMISQNEHIVSFRDSIFHLKTSKDFKKCTIQAHSPHFYGLSEKTNGEIFFFPIPDEPDNLLIAYNNTIIHFNNNSNKVLYKKFLTDRKAYHNRKYFKLDDNRICKLIDSFAYIYHIKTKKIERIDIKSLTVSYGALVKLFTDNNDIQWFGCNGCGIIKRDPRKKWFKSFKYVNPNDVFSKISQDQIPRFSPKLNVPQEFNCIVLDKEKVYWALIRKSYSNYKKDLYSFDTKSQNLILKSKLSYASTEFSGIYVDRLNRLWIHFQNQQKKYKIGILNKKNGELLASYTIPESIESPESFVSQLYFDNQDVMWLATINGLYALDEKNQSWRHWKNIPRNMKSLSTNGILSICSDPYQPNDFLWIGTEGGGINKFDKVSGECNHYTTKDGLPNNVAYCILQDSLKNLWISTNNGLSCFNPSQKYFRNFSEEDGLPGNEFNRNTAMEMQSGELMFGGINGFVIFNPNEILRQQPAAPIVFTSIHISNKPVDWTRDSMTLSSPLGYAKTITLQPGQNIFSIGFATLEYRSNAKKMYKYMLDGFDKDWTTPSNKNEVTYTNLSPGTYTFKVMGANTDGIWNEKPISMEIIVLPFWYQTWWFKMMLLMAISSFVYLLYRYRLQQGLKIEKLRNRIARDLHDEIGSSLSSISLYAESAKLVTKGNDKADQILSKIDINTTEMMEAMSDIVWAVNSSDNSISDLVNRLRSFAVMVTEAKNIKLIFPDNKDIPKVLLNMEQRKNIYLICKEAVSNAVKYSQCTVLEVGLNINNQHLHIIISDNGHGFEMNDSPINAIGHSMGGNGLKNMGSRAEEIGADLRIRSELRKGTHISIEIPI